jgi:putative PIN family toxin of toxin-antitoxin system
MIRACVDTNLLISYLLHTGSPGPPSTIVRAGIAGKFQLVVSETTVGELRTKALTKPYLAARIPPELLKSFIDLLVQAAEVVPASTERIRRITRDPKDDYLLTQSVLERVNALVTGDRDLLAIGEMAGVRIMSPAAFVALLGHQVRSERTGPTAAE